MKLEINRCKLCGKQARHIKIGYLCIKDFIDKGIVRIEYCPTKKMLANFFIKLLQGSLFCTFRDCILGHRPISDLNL